VVCESRSRPEDLRINRFIKKEKEFAMSLIFNYSVGREAGRPFYVVFKQVNHDGSISDSAWKVRIAGNRFSIIELEELRVFFEKEIPGAKEVMIINWKELDEE